MNKGIKSYFYTGLLALLPIVITTYILDWIFSFMIKLVAESILAVILREILSKFEEFLGIAKTAITYEILINLITILIILICTTIVGYTLKHVFFVQIGRKIEGVFKRAPIIKHVYTTISQIVSLLSSDRTANYKKVVALEYPRKGVYSIGFLTAENNAILENEFHVDKMCNIFIPTSPNPTSGMFVCVPVSELTVLDIKTDDAIKLIISGGVLVPNVKKNKEHSKEHKKHHSTDTTSSDNQL